VAWVLYQHYGDVGILADQFASMAAWVDVVARAAGETRLWATGDQFGDWLDPKAPPDKPGRASTSPHVVATAYFARSAEIVAQAAAVLGREADAARYAALAAQVRAAFAAESVTPAGRMVSDAATAYALALQFALLRSARQRQRAGRRRVSRAIAASRSDPSPVAASPGPEPVITASTARQSVPGGSPTVTSQWRLRFRPTAPPRSTCPDSLATPSQSGRAGIRGRTRFRPESEQPATVLAPSGCDELPWVVFDEAWLNRQFSRLTRPIHS